MPICGCRVVERLICEGHPSHLYCFPLVPSTALWISQSNGATSVSPSLVSKALNYHFYGPSEGFHVESCLAFIFSTSIASMSVKNHLYRIGVFAIQGIIFNLHLDAEAASSFLRRTRTTIVDSNFEIGIVSPMANEHGPNSPQPNHKSDFSKEARPTTSWPGQMGDNLDDFAPASQSDTGSARFDPCHQPEGPLSHACTDRGYRSSLSPSH